MNIWFISDLHLGHKNIIRYAAGKRQGSNIGEHNEWLVDCWNSRVQKGDIGYILGDVAFGHENLKYLDRMRGQKFLIRGNHDGGDIKVLLNYFENIYGFCKYKGFWLSHAPVHPSSLRGLLNLHGHKHNDVVRLDNGEPDLRYINLAVEHLNGFPISLEQLRLIKEERLRLIPDNAIIE